ncbi:hypothetical protein cyc_05986 [Cyclospora cayetanensis]|uniref:RxLR effector protein n=1 Tax=Cyclospora cayetanensis TaxID=88456 RepID=A0A1D3DAC0_9EIME|nr:hypothetical protein cyc_05986 [Cyclospora cayetanensis]
MRRYASLFVIAACICAGSSADDDDDYSPPVPLREAVTASVEPTDISDSSLTETPEDAFATEAKISDITKLSKGSSVAALDAEISETTENIKAPKRIQSRKHRVTDVIDEIMGGEFNTEVRKRFDLMNSTKVN